MDPYQEKLAELRGYVPFLNSMVRKLEGSAVQDQQLSKMKSLLNILTDPNKKLRLETLVKCEDVLQKLYEKIEGGPLPVEKRNHQNPNTPRSPSPEPHSSAANGGAGGSLSSYLQQVYDQSHRRSRPFEGNRPPKPLPPQDHRVGQQPQDHRVGLLPQDHRLSQPPQDHRGGLGPRFIRPPNRHDVPRHPHQTFPRQSFSNGWPWEQQQQQQQRWTPDHRFQGHDDGPRFPVHRRPLPFDQPEHPFFRNDPAGRNSGQNSTFRPSRDPEATGPRHPPTKPRPQQEELQTPASPESSPDLETPESPPPVTTTIATTVVPLTPASPGPQSPLSPTSPAPSIPINRLLLLPQRNQQQQQQPRVPAVGATPDFNAKGGPSSAAPELPANKDQSGPKVIPLEAQQDLPAAPVILQSPASPTPEMDTVGGPPLPPQKVPLPLPIPSIPSSSSSCKLPPSHQTMPFERDPDRKKLPLLPLPVPLLAPGLPHHHPVVLAGEASSPLSQSVERPKSPTMVLPPVLAADPPWPPNQPASRPSLLPCPDEGPRLPHFQHAHVGPPPPPRHQGFGPNVLLQHHHHHHPPQQYRPPLLPLPPAHNVRMPAPVPAPQSYGSNLLHPQQRFQHQPQALTTRQDQQVLPPPHIRPPPAGSGPGGKRPMTYGEYRKMRQFEEASARRTLLGDHPGCGDEDEVGQGGGEAGPLSLGQQQQPQGPVPGVHRNDPRRPPAVLASVELQKSREREKMATAVATAAAAAASTSGRPQPCKPGSSTMSSFRIPKKVKPAESTSSSQPSFEAGGARSSNSSAKAGAASSEQQQQQQKSSWRSTAPQRRGEEANRLSVASTDSDSEGELRIAEHESPSESEDHQQQQQQQQQHFQEHDGGDEDDPEKPPKKPAAPEVGSKVEGKTTKEMLHDLVASLKPEEADRLLERANHLQVRDGQLTLSELRELLLPMPTVAERPSIIADGRREEPPGSLKRPLTDAVDEEGDNEEVEQEGSAKGKKRATSKKQQGKVNPKFASPTPGTRKSRRLMHVEPPASQANNKGEDHEEDPDEENDNQLVIVEEAKEDEEGPPLTSSASMSRPRKPVGRPPKKGASRKRPAPDVGGPAVPADHEAVVETKKCHLEENEEDVKPVVVKKEPKEADLGVFQGLEEISLEDRFRLKRADAPAVNLVFERLKEGATPLNSLALKLARIASENDCDDDHGARLEAGSGERVQSESKAVRKTTEEGSSAFNRVKTTDDDDFDIEIESDPQRYYSQNLSNVIELLRAECGAAAVQGDVEEDVVFVEEDDDMDFFQVVRYMKAAAATQEEEEPVLETARQKPDFDAVKDADLVSLLTKSSSGTLFHGSKTAESLEALLSPDKVRHLFKCMASPTCCFSSDDPDSFAAHLRTDDHHTVGGVQGTSSPCCYCPAAGIAPKQADDLILHVIKEHGHLRFQCPFCFHRESSTLSLLLHQVASHPGKPRKMATCRAISPENPSSAIIVPQKVSFRGFRCRADATDDECGHVAASLDALSEHLYLDHSSSATSTDFQCLHCFAVFARSSRLILHCKSRHPDRPLLVNVRHAASADLKSPSSSTSSILSSDPDDEEESKENQPDHRHLRPPDEEENGERSTARSGLVGADLYRCGNSRCQFRTDSVADFKDHLAICEDGPVDGIGGDPCCDDLGVADLLLQDSSSYLFLRCFHCSKSMKHSSTLLEHLKTHHGPKRFACGLCGRPEGPYSSAVLQSVKAHMRANHRLASGTNFGFKVLPVDRAKNNPDRDFFVVFPRSVLLYPLGSGSGGGQGSILGKASSASWSSMTFSPNDELDSLPTSAISRVLLRCSVCDFATKVRLNMVKHLRLHQPGQDPPIVTPINPPSCEDGSQGLARMTSLINADKELEKLQASLSEEDLARMPGLVALENARFSCCDPECAYMTVDEVMLLYHIRTLHPDLEDYTCPHCIAEVRVAFEDVAFHLKCHGDMLFKCSYCFFYHWQKRTAEKHVAEQHPGAKVHVRDVRADALALEGKPAAATNKVAAKKSKMKVWSNKTGKTKFGKKGSGSVVLDQEPGEELAEEQQKSKAGNLKDQNSLYLAYRCGLCEVAEATLEGIRKHCKAVHDVGHQFRCSLCFLASDKKPELVDHFFKIHHKGPENSHLSPIIRLFQATSSVFEDSSSGGSAAVGEEGGKREPLWKRDMPGLRHIRGILYEDERWRPPADEVVVAKALLVQRDSSVLPSSALEQLDESKLPPSVSALDLDNYPLNCKECGLQKATVKGLKSHIKLLHLRTGKYLCLRCKFSANVLSSMTTHYRIQHPDESAEAGVGFEVKKDEANNEASSSNLFSQEFWKNDWNIPTLEERRVLLQQQGDQQVRKVKKGKGTVKPKKGQGQKVKRGSSKKKPNEDVRKKGNKGDHQLSNGHSQDEDEASPQSTSLGGPKDHSRPQNRPQNAQPLLSEKEISPFENVPTFKCQFCPKRSQYLDKMERHLRETHQAKVAAPVPSDSASLSGFFKVLSRDQVVDLLTVGICLDPLDTGNKKKTSGPSLAASAAGSGSSNLPSDYMCFYCDGVVGNIMELRAHFVADHDPENDGRLKVKKLDTCVAKDPSQSASAATAGTMATATAGAATTGYLECQVCGYLSAGFDRSKQKVHFHEEHPFEEVVNVSKYVLRSQPRSQAASGQAPTVPACPAVVPVVVTTNRIDVSKFIGMRIICPLSSSSNDDDEEPTNGCRFETLSMPAMNAHLRRHTQTFKCGHCGKTYPNSSEFHRHSAMSHGNRIPDLVKDPEAEAEFEALKALTEANLQLEHERQQMLLKEQELAKVIVEEEMKAAAAAAAAAANAAAAVPAARPSHGVNIARKSTTTKVKNSLNVARKSTTESRAKRDRGWLDDEADEDEEEYSFYGLEADPVDLSSVLTRMSIGGMEITLNASKMAELINLSPKIIVKGLD